MPDQADPRPRDAAAPEARSSFKPVALPALAAALQARKAVTEATKTTRPCPNELDRFGRTCTN